MNDGFLQLDELGRKPSDPGKANVRISDRRVGVGHTSDYLDLVAIRAFYLTR